MRGERAELKAGLQAKAEQAIEELLDWAEATNAPTLTEIEDKVLKLRKRLSEAMVETVIGAQASVQLVPKPICQECQHPLHYKAHKGTTVESRVGRLRLQRGHYYCEHCGSGVFPLDEQLQLRDGAWSEQVVKHAVWLSGLVTYEEAAAILDKVGQVSLASKSIWRRVKVWGERGQALDVKAQAVASALPARAQPVPGEAPSPLTLGVAMDGAMVHVRTEGWKELKVGSVFEVALLPTRDKHTGDGLDLAHAVATSYVAHLGGPEVFGQAVWAEARRRQWTRAKETVAVGDGAPWVWNLVAEHFFDSRQVVDWYHATTHLHQAAALLKGEGTPAAQQWFKDYETKLFEGHADQIADHLRTQAKTQRKVADPLRREAGYFADNVRRMQYLEIREDDLPIGSGMVESGCKQYRARFAGPGMRWSRPGLQRLLPVRTAIMSRRFDDWWQSVYQLPHK